MAEFRQEFGPQEADSAIAALDTPEELEAMLDEYLEEKGVVNAG